jgi:cytochrome P450
VISHACITGPRELSTTLAAAVPAIYSSNFALSKAPAYNFPGDDAHGSSFSVRNKKMHSERRKVWDRAFNGAAIASYEPKLFELVSLMIEKLRSREGATVDASEWSRWLAFDAMGLVGLSPR